MIREEREVMRLNRPVGTIADGSTVFDDSGSAARVGNRNPLAPVGAEGLLFARSAAGSSDSFVKEGFSKVLEGTTVLDRDGQEDVVLTLHKVKPVLVLGGGTGISSMLGCRGSALDNIRL